MDAKIGQSAIAAAVLACAIVGCATPYQPSSITGGFSESRLSPTMWRVSFLGNGFRTDDEVFEMTLLRAAELTLQSGFTDFAIVRAKDNSTATGVGVATASGSLATALFSPIKYPELSTVVEMRNAGGTGIYNAQFLVDSLGPKYKEGGAGRIAGAAGRHAE